MRDIFEIKDYWESAHAIEHLDSLSGCGYKETIDFMQVTDILKGRDKVLEIGVGLGYVTKGFYDRGFMITALDISEVALERVSQYCENNYLVSEMEQMPDDYFDVIICHNGIQHIPTFLLEVELKHVIRSLKKGGIFALEFISSPLAEDTGLNPDSFIGLGLDSNIGCYCRTPEVMTSLIAKHGGYVITSGVLQ